MDTIEVVTRSRECLVDISSPVDRAVKDSGVTEGLCTVYVPHTTAGVTINENADPDVPADIIAHLERLVPHDAGFKHFEGNSDSHIKASLMGFEQAVLIEDGSPVLGRWQCIYFCEFDGPRDRNIFLQVIPA